MEGMIELATNTIEPRLQTVPVIYKKSYFKYFFKHRYLYLMLIPALIYYIVFCYIPMYGATIAFKDFNMSKGIMGSTWVGLKYFSPHYSWRLKRVYSLFFER